MSVEWESKKVGDVLQLEYGKPLPDEDRSETGKYSVYGANGEKARSNKFYYDKPTIIVGRKGSAGELKLSEEKFWPLDVTYFATFDNSRYELNFLYYMLGMLDLPSMARGVKPGINRNDVYSLGVSVPPIKEQQRIVAILEEAFAGIATAKANAERNLRNARAVFDSQLEIVFTQRGEGWIEKRLDQIGRTQTGSTPNTSDSNNYGDFIPFVKPGDFNSDGSLDYAKNALSEQGLAGARTVATGSVLMVCIGATIGKCGYCDREVTTNQQINSLTPIDGSGSQFLYYQMLTDRFQRQVIHASGQATLPIINKSKWSALPLWHPPAVAEQKRIADAFNVNSVEIQRLESIYTRKLTALDELKQSLLHQAFSGKL